MKTTRRLLALITVLALVLALGTTAFAATITVDNVKKGETYTAYKLLNYSKSGDNYTYYLTKAEYDTGLGAALVAAGFEFKANDDDTQYILINADDLKAAGADALVAELKEADLSNAISTTPATATEDEQAVFSGLPAGYYFVTSSLGSLCTLASYDAEALIVEKNSVDTITKTVKEDSTNTYGESNDAQIGDTVAFSSTITLVKGTRNVVVTDTMTSGLTYKMNAAIAGLTKDTDYTISETSSGFVITFKDTYLNGLTENATLTLTYSATLNEGAVKVTVGEGENAPKTVAIEQQTNSIVLTYGNAQSDTKTTTTTTHKFSVLKYDGGKFDKDAANKTALAGAVFSLKKGTGDDADTVDLVKIDDNNYRIAKADETGTVTTFTTNATGAIVIWGVDADNDYSLVEITPPAGYNALTAPVSVTVAADNTTIAEVENLTGSVLPSTGGMGTTIFYLLGGLMVLGALVVMVTNKRMRAN